MANVQGDHQQPMPLPGPNMLSNVPFPDQFVFTNGTEYTVPQPMPQSSDSPLWNILDSFQAQPQPDIDLWDQFRSQNLTQPEPENWDWYPFQGTDLFETWGANGASPEVPPIWAAPQPPPTWAESSTDAIRRQALEQESLARFEAMIGDQSHPLPAAKRAKLSSAREEKTEGEVLQWQRLDIPDVDEATLLRLTAAHSVSLWLLSADGRLI